MAFDGDDDEQYGFVFDFESDDVNFLPNSDDVPVSPYVPQPQSPLPITDFINAFESSCESNLDQPDFTNQPFMPTRSEGDPNFSPLPVAATLFGIPEQTETQPFTEQLQLGPSGGNDELQLDQMVYDSNGSQTSCTYCESSNPQSVVHGWTQLTPPSSIPSMRTGPPHLSTQHQHSADTYNPVGILNSSDCMEFSLLPGSKQTTLKQNSNSIPNLLQSTYAGSQQFDPPNGNYQNMHEDMAPFFNPIVSGTPMPCSPTVDLTQQFGATQSHYLEHEANLSHLNQLHGETALPDQHLQQTQWIESFDQYDAWPACQPVQGVNSYNDPRDSMCQTPFSYQNPVEATNEMSYVINSQHSPWPPHYQNTSFTSSTSFGNQQLSEDNQQLNRVPFTPESQYSMMPDPSALLSSQQFSQDDQLDQVQVTFNQTNTEFQHATMASPSTVFRHQPLLDHPDMPSSVSPYEPLTLSRIQQFFDNQPIRVHSRLDETGLLQQSSVVPESPLLTRSQEIEVQALLDNGAAPSGSSRNTYRQSQLSSPQTQQEVASYGTGMVVPLQREATSSNYNETDQQNNFVLQHDAAGETSTTSRRYRRAAEREQTRPVSRRRKLSRVTVPEYRGTGINDRLVLRYTNLRPVCNASYDQKFEDDNQAIDPLLRMTAAWMARRL